MSEVLTPSTTLSSPQNKILALAIKDKNSLYMSYMPFIKGGGLFIPTPRAYQLGDEVFMLITLLEEPDRIPVPGKVVWISPRGTQGGRAAGIGIQFGEQDKGVLRTKIDTYLAGFKSERPTHTM